MPQGYERGRDIVRTLAQDAGALEKARSGDWPRWDRRHHFNDRVNGWVRRGRSDALTSQTLTRIHFP